MAEKLTRREVIKRVAYVAPVILTLTAVPAFAGGGSGHKSKGSSWSDGKYSKKNDSWNAKDYGKNK